MNETQMENAKTVTHTIFPFAGTIMSNINL